MTVAHSATEEAWGGAGQSHPSQKPSKKYLCGDQCEEKKNGDLYCWGIWATAGRAGTNKGEKMMMRQRGLWDCQNYLWYYLMNLKIFQLHLPVEAKDVLLAHTVVGGKGTGNHVTYMHTTMNWKTEGSPGPVDGQGPDGDIHFGCWCSEESQCSHPFPPKKSLARTPPASWDPQVPSSLFRGWSPGDPYELSEHTKGK